MTPSGGRNRGAQRAVAFVHIPKAAGSTLHAVLARQYAPDRTLIFDLQRPQSRRMIADLTPLQKERVLCLRGHMPYGMHRLIEREVSYITVLRDPVRRINSKYRNLVRRPQRALEMGFPLERLATLEDFLDLQVERCAMNFQTRLIAGSVDPERPLFPYPEPVPDSALQTAIGNIERHFAVAGLVERFDESVVLMKQAFGWGPLFYARRNVDQGAKGRPDRGIPEPVADRIRELNSLDCQLVDYVAARLDRQIQAAGEAFRADLGRTRRAGRVLFSLQKLSRNPPVKRAWSLMRRR